GEWDWQEVVQLQLLRLGMPFLIGVAEHWRFAGSVDTCNRLCHCWLACLQALQSKCTSQDLVKMTLMVTASEGTVIHQPRHKVACRSHRHCRAFLGHLRMRQC
ncbi:unnamed protein product, partial [Chrysoparadoxa australica]